MPTPSTRKPGQRQAAVRRSNRASPAVALTLDHLVTSDSPRDNMLTRDGKWLCFLRRAHRFDQVFVMSAQGGFARQVSFEMRSFKAPVWSPDGKLLAAESEGQVWLFERDGANPRALTRHPAGSRMLRFSPDGKKLAYLSKREGWDQVYVQPLDGKHGLAKITKRAADIREFCWSPDSRRIAAVEQPMDALSTTRIDEYTVPGGRSRALACEPDTMNELPAYALDGRTLVYVSDRGGFRRLCRLDLKTRAVETLTPQDAASPTRYVEDGFKLADDGHAIAYEHNEDGRKHVRLLDLDTHKVHRVTGTGGTEWVLGFAGRHRVVVHSSTPWEPSDLHLLDFKTGRCERLTDSRPAGFRREHAVTVERARFRARDGWTIPGWLYKPKLKRGQRVPAVVLCHGGPSWQSFFMWQPLWQYLALKGYALFAVDFRGSTGYGREFWLGNIDEWGHADLHDCVDAARHLRSLPWIEGDRVGIMGGSYGGYMALCGMALSPGEFRCGIDLYGDSDIAESYRLGDRIGRVDLHRAMGSPDQEDRKALYRRGSPFFHAERITGPILMIHGRKDRRVVPEMTEMMERVLKIEGKYHEVKYYDDEAHGFLSPDNQRDCYQRVERFLGRFLKGDGEEE